MSLGGVGNSNPNTFSTNVKASLSNKIETQVINSVLDDSDSAPKRQTGELIERDSIEDQHQYVLTKQEEESHHNILTKRTQEGDPLNKSGRDSSDQEDQSPSATVRIRESDAT